MSERTGIITFQGNGLTLVGSELKVGDKAPDFTLLDNGLAPKTMADYAGKAKIVVTVPSLDTAVCNIEARKFNEQASSMKDKVDVIVVSMDLPFAQARWAEDAGVKDIVLLSDYMTADFAEAWGVLIKELRLLTRAVYVVDKDGAITYVETVPEITNEPDYAAAVGAAEALA
jgi:thiol peroxidase